MTIVALHAEDPWTVAATMPEGLWVGIVRYRRDGLMYEHAVSGELLDVLPDIDGGHG